MAPVALVTGASGRIGRALAIALAGAGYDVAVHYRSAAEEAAAVVQAIEATGRRARALPAELSQAGAPAALIAAAGSALGPLTVLVNNASLFEDDRMGAIARARFDAHIDANLRAPIELAQAFAAQVPAATEDGAAAIVNMLDQRVLKPNPQFFSYAVAKSALWTATKMMAQALAPRIRVNGVGPGPTLPSIHQDKQAFAAEAAAVPLARAATLDDITGAAVYLLGARAVTGQMIAVDGGQHLAWRTPDIAGD